VGHGVFGGLGLDGWHRDHLARRRYGPSDLVVACCGRDSVRRAVICRRWIAVHLPIGFVRSGGQCRACVIGWCRADGWSQRGQQTRFVSCCGLGLSRLGVVAATVCRTTVWAARPRGGWLSALVRSVADGGGFLLTRVADVGSVSSTGPCWVGCCRTDSRAQREQRAGLSVGRSVFSGSDL
jgi:hypothetical protein